MKRTRTGSGRMGILGREAAWADVVDAATAFMTTCGCPINMCPMEKAKEDMNKPVRKQNQRTS